MKTESINFSGAVSIAIALFVGITALAQDGNKAGAAKESDTNARPAPSPVNPSKPKLTQEELEAKFKATLTKATLSGRWCAIKEDKLTAEKAEKYTILGVSKLGNDAWLIHARIQYGQKDLTLPIPVKVKWAGDTPIITVDDFGIPGGDNYSARVMIYNQTYAGTWSGGDHAGLLNGVITNEKE